MTALILPFPGPGRIGGRAAPNRCLLGTAARRLSGSPRPWCAPRRMRPEREPARPRDGRYKSAGLRTPALPASRGPFPAPGCSDPPGPPHYDRYACVTGFRSLAAPGSPGQLGSRGSLQLPGCRDSSAAERRLPPAASGEGLAGWGRLGARRGRPEP